MREAVKILAEGSEVVIVKDGKVVVRMPYQAAGQFWQGVKIKAEEAEAFATNKILTPSQSIFGVGIAKE